MATGPPRPPQERKSDALSKLTARHADAWVASASPRGVAHLVPLSFAWNDEYLIIAVEATAVTARNIVASGRARVGLGGTRDVVMIDVLLLNNVPVGEAPTEIGERYAEQADWDPRSSGGDFHYLLLGPDRIQVWREVDEIPGRTVLQHGAWLV